MKTSLTILLLSILLATPHARAEESVEATAPLVRASDKAEAIDEDNSEILQRLYPFYALYGHHEIKLQVSFKTPLIRKVPLYFGYTQLMFYDFFQHEKLFTDVIYNPQLFYQLATPGMGVIKSVDFGLFDHNSNGKPLPDHRSYNDEYVRVNLEAEGRRWMTKASVQAQYLYGLLQTNADIQNYIGPLAFRLSFTQLFTGWIDKSEIVLQATPGGKFADRWDTGGYQLSWSFRLGGIRLVPAFYLQYYNGYAETLLNYNQHVDVFRAGLLF